MSGPESSPPNGAEPKVSRIVITFPGPGLADATIRAEMVSAGQMQAAAWFLDQYVRELREQQLAGNGPGIVVVGADGLAGLSGH